MVMTENHWAAQAFIQSFLDAYATLYGCQTCSVGDLNSLRYGANIPAKMEDCEVFSLSQDPEEVRRAIANLPLSPCEHYVLNIFHAERETQEIEKRFEAAGFRYAFTNVVRGLPLPAPMAGHDLAVKTITDAAQVAYVNLTHQYFQPMPASVLDHPNVRAFYADVDGQAAGWGLLVTTADQAAYISDMFTLPSFRGRGVAEALLGAMNQAAAAQGKAFSLLVPSVMAWNYYQRFGYETLVCFSIFHQVNP
ncbi:GNAT family N-acetyltransferase [bacterium]|nr:MAG: GNAT family N-acetyltransferase [bacterium]